MPAPTPIYCLGFLILLSFPAAAQQVSPPSAVQQVLSGKIKRRSSDEVLPSVTVINRTQKKTNISDVGGNYRIPAKPGDTIVFSSAGYHPDTAFVSAWMFEEKEGYLVALSPNAEMLAPVRVGDLSNYQLDSTRRREEYAWLFPKHPYTLLGRESRAGFGVVIRPVEYFGKKQAQRRRLRKRIKQQEIDHYIDFRFPAAYVSRVTGLHDDSLRIFMYRYRPDYTFCRSASNEDILLYINEKLKEYHKGGPPAGPSSLAPKPVP